MRTPRRPGPNILCRYTPLAAAMAGLLVSHNAFAGCTASPHPPDPAPPNPSPVFCVTNTNASGAGSLAQAFADANNPLKCANTTPTIGFDIPGTGPFVISPSTGLSFGCSGSPPGSIHGVLDGTTQTGHQPNSSSTGWNGVNPIVISGGSMFAFNVLEAIDFGYGASLTVKGVDFENFMYGGGATGIAGPVNVYGSRIANGGTGVRARAIFDGSGTIRSKIGGPSLGERNLITGQNQAAVQVCCENGQVDIINNVLSGSSKGVMLSSTASSVTIEDNIIQGHSTSGVSVNNSNSIAIRRNYISGNGADGIYLSGAQAVTIEQNKIGLGTSGADANLGNGIYSQSASYPTYISKNEIAFNSGDGFRLNDGNGNELWGNSIHSNGGKAINLNYTEPQPDANDADTGGPNEGQNFPIISSVSKRPLTNSTVINWSLNSVTNTDFGIEFFSNPSLNATPQAQAFLDPSVLGFAPAGGNTGATTSLAGTTTIPGLHDFITAVATDIPLGNTSELTAMKLARGLGLPSATMAFGNVVVNSQSADQVMNITSLGADTVTLTYIGDSGLCYGGNPPCTTGQFMCSTTCTTSTPYAAGPACTFTAKFAPISLGAATTTVHICHNAGNDTITLTGTGVNPPPPTFSPASHDFGSVTIGGFSATQTFTLTNTAPVAIAVGSFTATPPFQVVSSLCTASLPPGASCTAGVKFAPTTPGPYTGSLMVPAGTGSASATLTGNATLLPALVIAPSSHDFGSVLVGQVSATQPFTIQNSGASATTVSGVGTTAAFEVASTNCGTSLEAGASCVANVRFVPSLTGLVSGTFSATGAGGTSSVPLAGTGVRQAAVSMPTEAIEFGALTLNGEAVVRSLTLRSTGNTTLGISSITLAAPFTVEHNCPVSLGEGSSCEIRVGFNPAELGDFAGVLTVNTNAPGAESLQVRVTAKVQPRPEPLVRVSPRSIGFGARLVGSGSSSQTVTLRNEGGAMANINLTLNMPHFTIVNTSCGTTLAPQASCGVELAFVPQGFGPRRSQLVVSSNSPDSPINVELGGVGCRPDTGGMNRGGGIINCSP